MHQSPSLLGVETESREPPLQRDQLADVFRGAEKPRERWLIGAEAEKFGVEAETGAPLQYEGEHGVLRVLAALADSHGWQGKREHAGGPIIALYRGDASVTLEPGAQLELSGAPHDSCHAVAAELEEHVAELREISQQMNLRWLTSGFHPVAKQEQLPWVPKQRYAIMREYLPPLGSGALDMMRRTATVQVNLDYSSEQDALRKLRVALKLTPIVVAMTANGPFSEGCVNGLQTRRGHVWLNMDRSRSGLVERVWRAGASASYEDYVEWALDAGMFLLKRDDRVIANTGQTFRSFLEDGFQGHRATMDDWNLHLQTLFPEVRLKRTLEVRCCDSLPGELAPTVPALYTGLLYDETSLAEAEELTEKLTLEAVEQARPAIVKHAIRTDLMGIPLRTWAEQVLTIAAGGLARRGRFDARGRDEAIYLAPLAKLTERGKTPADIALEGLKHDCPDLPSDIVKRTQI